MSADRCRTMSGSADPDGMFRFAHDLCVLRWVAQGPTTTREKAPFTWSWSSVTTTLLV